MLAKQRGGDCNCSRNVEARAAAGHGPILAAAGVDRLIGADIFRMLMNIAHLFFFHQGRFEFTRKMNNMAFRTLAKAILASSSRTDSRKLCMR